MRNRLLLSAVFVVALAPAVRADEQAEVRGLIDKAIKARGDEAKQAKLKAVTFKMKGTFHGMGTAMPYAGDWAIQGPAQYSMKLESEINGQKFNIAIVQNGDKGWMKFADMLQEMDKDKIAEQKHEMYTGEIVNLVTLKDKKFTLSSLGDSKVENRPAVGVKVASQGQRDVHLYFDKETHMLLKYESRVKDDAGQEANQEVYQSDYKVVDGVKHPMKMMVKRDGKLYVEGEVLEFKAVEKLDDSLFDKP